MKKVAKASVQKNEAVEFLKFQRNQSIRRNEMMRYSRFYDETRMQVSMSNTIIMPGLGLVPAEIMEQALELVPPLR